ncbi:alkene reductase [Diaphorobacter caeni]|uniref:alkene reductase n=1 Tax=Diaphorobacter caeni TaxID=2784387 RepID=UPI00189084DE|nr:alkene reductase [Diaphorobacter caeni]MBF5006165.1 alkene reductase [Diaphorobacter caeni]
MEKVFTPFNLKGLELKNRVVMAPMSRARIVDSTPDASTALYYGQRAGAGLIIAEGANVSHQACGTMGTAGIYLPEHVAGWRLTTQAVHAAGGRIFLQLAHAGRVSHQSLQPAGAAPVSSTFKHALNTTVFGINSAGQTAPLQTSMPQCLNAQDLADIYADFVRAAKLAMEAGFDGVEIHAGNGFLFEQFINGALNDRADLYGGPPAAHRLRFLLETLDAVASAIGSDHVGVKVTPFSRLADMPSYEGEAETWLAFASAPVLDRLAYVHAAFAATDAAFPLQFRQVFHGTLMRPSSPDTAAVSAMLDQGLADLVVMGRPFISNPDLVERMRNGWPLSMASDNTVYGGGSAGYTDYPRYQPNHEADTSSADALA